VRFRAQPQHNQLLVQAACRLGSRRGSSRHVFRTPEAAAAGVSSPACILLPALYES
jgi:hypothetical protein